MLWRCCCSLSTYVAHVFSARQARLMSHLLNPGLCDQLKKGKFVEKPFWGIDLGSEHEKYLTNHFSCPVIVYNYPKSFKSFYMKQNDDGRTVQAMDVLVPGVRCSREQLEPPAPNLTCQLVLHVPACMCWAVRVVQIGELMGGSAREDDLEKLERLMAEKGVPKDGLQWYLDLRRYGTCPHAGFGLGFERLVMYVTGVANIRDVIPYPRYPGHASD